MSFKSESIKESIRKRTEMVIEMVSGEGAQEATADQTERRLWKAMLEIGRELMQLFFTVRSEKEAKPKVIEEGEKRYGYVDQSTRRYVSIFGEVKVERRYYWVKGEKGKHPLDEALSLPERSYSDWVQEMMGELCVICPEAEAMRWLARWFGLDIPKRSAQQVMDEHAEGAEAYYQQQAPPEVEEADTILAALADGTGIRMIGRDSPPPQARRRKDTKTASKQAVATALYTIAPYPRSSDSIIRALMPDHPVEEPPDPRPKPTGKQVFGTMAGKEAAFTHLAQQVTRRQHDQLVHRIALTDGDIALQKQVHTSLPGFTLILDLLHVAQYLWKAANVLWDETNPDRELWITDALRCVLEDQLDTLLLHLRNQAAYVTPTQAKTLTQVANYLERNRPYMQYHLYLERGWPIGSGVIEGTCRHLVKDRFDRTGMRWSIDGAETLLDLRAIYLNDDWDDFQRFRRHHAHLLRFDSPHPDSLPETLALERAA